MSRFDHLHRLVLPTPTARMDRLAYSDDATQWCIRQFGANDHKGINGRWFRRGLYDFYFRDASDAAMFKLAWGDEPAAHRK